MIILEPVYFFAIIAGTFCTGLILAAIAMAISESDEKIRKFDEEMAKLKEQRETAERELMNKRMYWIDSQMKKGSN